MTIILADSHCHLAYYSKEELPEVVKRANENSVKILNNICVDISDFESVLNSSRPFKNVFCTVGTHPCHVYKELLSPEEIIKICKKNPDKIIGLGETGLDLYHMENEKNTLQLQLQSLENHSIAAKELDLPLVIHSRNSDKEIGNALENMVKKYDVKGVMHSFNGGEELLKSVIDIGLYISFSGMITFKNAPNLRELAKIIPRERLLIETDSPYLAPVPDRGKRNEPAYVRNIAEVLAEIIGCSFEEIAATTTDNFLRLFSKAKI